MTAVKWTDTHVQSQNRYFIAEISLTSELRNLCAARLTVGVLGYVATGPWVTGPFNH